MHGVCCICCVLCAVCMWYMRCVICVVYMVPVCGVFVSSMWYVNVVIWCWWHVCAAYVVCGVWSMCSVYSV